MSEATASFPNLEDDDSIKTSAATRSKIHKWILRLLAEALGRVEKAESDAGANSAAYRSEVAEYNRLKEELYMFIN